MNKAVVFDLDGTIYYGEELAFYAKEASTCLAEDGYKVLFLTNNSTKTIEQINNKLSNFGLHVLQGGLYTSAYATALYLLEVGLKKVFLIGSDGFADELGKRGIEIVSEHEAKAVVIGLDFTFNYETIAKALIAVTKGAKIIASNVDKNFPIEGGILRPGSNAIVASLLGVTNKKLDYIVGKPNSYLLDIIVKDWNIDKEHLWVVGDSQESDIAMAKRYGCKHILVSSEGNSLKDVVNIIRKSHK